MRNIKALYCIAALLALLSITGCANTVPQPSSEINAVTTSAPSGESNTTSEDKTAASVEIFKDIVSMIDVMKENLDASFLTRSDGYQSNISVAFNNENTAIFSAEGIVCLAKSDVQGDWRYSLLNCRYFGDGDYRFLANENGAYVAISNYSNKIIVLNTETKEVSLLRFKADESVSLTSWDSDVLYFDCQSAIPAYAYNATTYSLNSVPRNNEIPKST
jgi:hypothetical protein